MMIVRSMNSECFLGYYYNYPYNMGRVVRAVEIRDGLKFCYSLLFKELYNLDSLRREGKGHKRLNKNLICPNIFFNGTFIYTGGRRNTYY